MLNSHGEYRGNAETWSAISKLRERLIDDERTAASIMTDPRTTLTEIGLDVAFANGNGELEQLSDMLEAMNIRQRCDIIRSISDQTLKLDDLTDTQAILFINVNAFVNVNAGINVNAWQNVNAFTQLNVVGDEVLQGSVPGMDATKGGVVISEEFVVSQLSHRMKEMGMSKHRQIALIGYVLRSYEDEISKSIDEGPRPYRFEYKGLQFDLSVAASASGGLEVVGGAVLN